MPRMKSGSFVAGVRRECPARRNDWKGLPCNEEKERKGKIENPSGRDFSAKKKQGEVVCYLP